mmetsp:Transcript_116042/g.323216  ORF Transcript_116042/g.323216 Transcript_116042/m.323216 type:complete len:389 (-) Transcript_116042:61-1227(-)
MDDDAVSPLSHPFPRDIALIELPLFRELSAATSYKIEKPGQDGQSEVYRVVTGQIPEDLLPHLVQPFTDQERREIFHHVDLLSAQTNQDVPKALWIFGPPAVGKTTIKDERASELFGQPDNAVTIDGDLFRSIHKGFQLVKQHGLRNGLVHADAWKTLQATAFMSTLKEDIFKLAVRRRQHLVIPEAGTNTERVNDMLAKLEASGYEMHALCLWAPMCETVARGRPRSVKDGKVFDTKSYRKSTENTLSFGRLWEEKIAQKNPHYNNVRYYDNTVFPSHAVRVSAFEDLVRMTDQEAERHASVLKDAKQARERADAAVSEVTAQGRGAPHMLRAAVLAWRANFLGKLSQTTATARWCGRLEGFLLGAVLATVWMLSAQRLRSRTSSEL